MKQQKVKIPPTCFSTCLVIFFSPRPSAVAAARCSLPFALPLSPTSSRFVSSPCHKCSMSPVFGLSGLVFFFFCSLFCCCVQRGGQVLDTVFTTLSLSPSCAYRNAHTRAHSCQAPPGDHLAVMLGAPPLPFNPSPPFLLLLFCKNYNQKCAKIVFIGFSRVILNLLYFLYSNSLGFSFLCFLCFSHGLSDASGLCIFQHYVELIGSVF